MILLLECIQYLLACTLFHQITNPLRTHVGHHGPRVATIDNEVFTRVIIEGSLLDAGQGCHSHFAD